MGKLSIFGTLTEVMQCSHSTTVKSLLLLSVIHINSVLDFGNHIPDQSCGVSSPLSPSTFTETHRTICHPPHSGEQFQLSLTIDHVLSHLTTQWNGQTQREPG